MDTFLDFLGLEIGTSIVRLNQLRDYWSKETFLGHRDFSGVMGRDKFLNTRTCLKIHPNTKFSSSSTNDPLWHSRHILNHFNKNCVEIGTPRGASSYDEITIRCKACCLSKSYIKNKPTPYGIRLYA